MNIRVLMRGVRFGAFCIHLLNCFFHRCWWIDTCTATCTNSRDIFRSVEGHDIQEHELCLINMASRQTTTSDDYVCTTSLGRQTTTYAGYFCTTSARLHETTNFVACRGPLNPSSWHPMPSIHAQRRSCNPTGSVAVFVPCTKTT